jgi:hypothetical protein
LAWLKKVPEKNGTIKEMMILMKDEKFPFFIKPFYLRQKLGKCG